MNMPLVIDGMNGSLLNRRYLDKALEIGRFVFHITVNNFRKIIPYPSLEEALKDLALCREWLERMAEKAMLVKEPSDIDTATRAGKIGIILGYQNMPGNIQSIEILSLFYALGVRIIQITHNDRNLMGDGCAESKNAGLSSLGRQVIKEMNRLGIVIDLSHVGEATSIETLEISSQPAAVTHANSATVLPSSRNKSDAVLDALKRNDGVIGITFFPPFINRKRFEPSIDDVMAQIDYIAERIGTRHIGIGSDFIAGQPRERYEALLRHPEIYGDWPWQFPISGIEALDDLFSLLLKRGYSKDNVAGIAGGNFRRVLDRVWSHGGKDG